MIEFSVASSEADPGIIQSVGEEAIVGDVQAAAGLLLPGFLDSCDTLTVNMADSVIPIHDSETVYIPAGDYDQAVLSSAGCVLAQLCSPEKRKSLIYIGQIQRQGEPLPSSIGLGPTTDVPFESFAFLGGMSLPRHLVPVGRPDRFVSRGPSGPWAVGRVATGPLRYLEQLLPAELGRIAERQKQ